MAFKNKQLGDPLKELLAEPMRHVATLTDDLKKALSSQAPRHFAILPVTLVEIT